MYESAVELICSEDITVNTSIATSAESLMTLNFQTDNLPIAQCGDDYVHYNNMCYAYKSIPASWYEADKVCRKDGGYLVTVSDAAEDAFVASLIQNRAWIGLNAVSNNRIFVWASDETASYRNWASYKDSEPNNSGGNEDCTEIWDEVHGWNDLRCDRLSAYVCERPMIKRVSNLFMHEINQVLNIRCSSNKFIATNFEGISKNFNYKYLMCYRNTIGVATTVKFYID